MIEQYIERTCGSLQEKLGDRGSVAVSQLKAFLPADALAWCKADATEHLTREWKEHGSMLRIMNASAENRRVARAALSSMVPFFLYEFPDAFGAIRQAITFAEGYTRTPRQALTQQVFRDASTVSGEILQIRLAAAVEYRYLPTLLVRNLAFRPQISREEFEASLQAIDDAAMRQHNPDEFARLMSPILRWSALSGGDPQCIPVDSLLDFLADKRLQVLRDYVASIARIRTRTAMDFQEIASLVRDIEVKDVTVLRGPHQPTIVPPVIECPAPEVTAQPAPLEESTTSVAPDADLVPLPELPAEPTPAPLPEIPAPVEPDGPPSAGIEVPSPVLAERKFSPELRASLSSSLFHGNVAYFDVTVNELIHMDNWREAATYLTDLLEINRLNPYAADVMQFTDTVRRWFVHDDEETTP